MKCTRTISVQLRRLQTSPFFFCSRSLTDRLIFDDLISPFSRVLAHSIWNSVLYDSVDYGLCRRLAGAVFHDCLTRRPRRGGRARLQLAWRRAGWRAGAPASSEARHQAALHQPGVPARARAVARARVHVEELPLPCCRGARWSLICCCCCGRWLGAAYRVLPATRLHDTQQQCLTGGACVEDPASRVVLTLRGQSRAGCTGSRVQGRRPQLVRGFGS